MAERDPHRRFASQLWLRLFGLLEEGEEQSLEAHAAACPPCAARMNAFRELRPGEPPDGHIPAQFLARWDREAPALEGMARELVRRHVESCSECRADLEMVGMDPSLIQAGEGRSKEPVHAMPEVTEPRKRASLVPWLGGGLVGAALAASIAVVLLPRLAPPPPGGLEPPAVPVEPEPVPSPPPAPSGSRVSIGYLGSSARLPGKLRGSAAEVFEISLSRSARFLSLALPELFLDDTTRVVVRCSGPSGESLGSFERPWRDLAGGKPFAIGSADEPLPAGDYTLTVSFQMGGAGPTELEYIVRVRRAG
jgi:hypothetical protein